MPLLPTPPNGAADGIICAPKSLRATPPLRMWRTKRRKSSSSGPYQYATSGAGRWLMWSMTSVSAEYGLTTRTGPKTSSLANSHVLVDVTHDRGRDLSSGTVGQRFPCGSDGFDRRTVGPGVVDEPDDAVEVGLVDRGTVVVVGDDRREHAAQCLARGVDEVVDAVMGHEDIVGADTHLSPVDHSRLGDARSRSVDVGIRRHHHRILAAQLQRDRDEVLRGGLLHQDRK